MHHLLLGLLFWDVDQRFSTILDAFLYLSFDCPLIVFEGFFESFKLTLLSLVLVDFALKCNYHLSPLLFTFFNLSSQLFQFLFSFFLVFLYRLELKVFPLEFFLELFKYFFDFLDLAVLVNETHKLFFFNFFQLWLPDFTFALYLLSKFGVFILKFLNSLTYTLYIRSDVTLLSFQQFKFIFILLTYFFHFVSPLKISFFNPGTAFFFLAFYLILTVVQFTR